MSRPKIWAKKLNTKTLTFLCQWPGEWASAADSCRYTCGCLPGWKQWWRGWNGTSCIFLRQGKFAEACVTHFHTQTTHHFCKITLHSLPLCISISFSFFKRCEVSDRRYLGLCTQTGSVLISTTITQTCLVIIAAFLVHVHTITWYVGCRGEHLVTIRGIGLDSVTVSTHLLQKTIYCCSVTLPRGRVFVLSPCEVCKELVCTDDALIARF